METCVKKEHMFGFKILRERDLNWLKIVYATKQEIKLMVIATKQVEEFIN
jgi:hypothetical protein